MSDCDIFKATEDEVTAMHKMLTIAVFLALSGSAWADGSDRSALSFEENMVINMACQKSAVQGGGAFNSCVAQQMVALHDHPSPDLSNVSAKHKEAITEVCGYLRYQGIGPYNDCVRKALEHSAKNEHAPANSRS
jgi:hypothetical protein